MKEGRARDRYIEEIKMKMAEKDSWRPVSISSDRAFEMWQLEIMIMMYIFIMYQIEPINSLEIISICLFETQLT